MSKGGGDGVDGDRADNEGWACSARIGWRGHVCEKGLGGDGEGGREDGGVVDSDDENVVAGLWEREPSDFADQINAVLRALGGEGACDYLLRRGGRQPHGDLEPVVSSGAASDGEKPCHRGVDDWELCGTDAGKNAEDGVFAGGGVGVHGVAGEPAEELGLGCHGASWLALYGRGNFFVSASGRDFSCARCFRTIYPMR